MNVRILASLMLEGSDLWPAALLALAVVTAAVIWIYPPQVRGNGVLGWVPPGLRWLALAALALALLRPVLLEPNSAVENGAVMVLVDTSESMSVTDSGRTPAQRVALAAALGKLPEGVRSGQVAGVADRIGNTLRLTGNVLGAQSDLDYARVSGRGLVEKQTNLQNTMARYAEAVGQLAIDAGSLAPGSELRARLLAMSEVPAADAREEWSRLPEQYRQLGGLAHSLQEAADKKLYEANSQVRQAGDALASESRLSLVQEVLLDTRAGLAPALLRKGPVFGYSFSSELQPLELIGSRRSSSPAPWRAVGPQSDLTGAVAAALNLAGRLPVKAIILFSDGRQIGGKNDLTSTVRPSGVRVFTVDVAAPQVPDAWISAVSPVAGSAFAGETVEGQIEVRCRDLASLPTKVTISGSQGQQEVALVPRPGRGRAGVVELTARYSMPVGPSGASPADKLVFTIPTAADEVTRRNNRVERWLKVSSEQVRVLLCAGEPTWDYLFLRNALSNRPWVRLESVLLDERRPRLEMTPGQILQQDVVILSDVPVGALNLNQWDAVSRLASDRGGSAVLVAGANNAIADYGRQPIAGALLPYHDLRPTWKQWPGERGAFRFVPTPLGESQMLRLEEGTDGLRRWQEFPGLFRYLQIPEKNLFGDVRQLLVETDSGSPVLTERLLGVGHAYFLALDETWRWRRPGTTRDPGRFWEQLVRRAAGEPYAASSGAVALDVSRVACEPGETVNVRARVRGGLAGAGDSSYPLQVVLGGKTVATVVLRSVGRGRYQGQVRDLREGNYQLEIRGSGRSARSVASVPLRVAASDEAELRDVSGEPATLNRIARSTGGEHLTLDEVDRLASLLDGLRAGESQFIRRPLYNSPLLFVFVLSCLAGEWALRKRYGLA
ncbi:MAG TPA: hypothetical protein VK797_00060 [Tepidisphaeraceae bacterium]|nr:hypothetical protein [Tepidisphaeraceae bacterium]